jgi:chromate reductase
MYLNQMKTVLAIVGSASRNSTNLRLVEQIADLAKNEFNLVIFDTLHELPHFDPELSIAGPPQVIMDIRNKILNADGIIICTPEYVFSIPSGLKNLVEWCVATTVFSKKPAGLITASASGVKGHEELKLIMRTVEAIFTEETTLLIQGVKSKINKQGIITDETTSKELKDLVRAFKILLDKPSH